MKFVTLNGNAGSPYLPTTFVDEMDVPTIKKELNLNWEVEKRPNYDERGKLIPNSYHLVKPGNGGIPDVILNTHVKERYNVIQFQEGLDWFRYFLEEDLLRIDNALIVDNSMFGVTCDMSTEAEVLPGDSVNRYFVLSLSHTSGFPRMLGFTDIRPICQNTLYAASAQALSKAGAAFSLNEDPDKAFKKARSTIDVVNRRFHDVDVKFYRETNTIKVTPSERELLFRKLVGIKLEGWNDVPERLINAYELLEHSYHNSPGMEVFDANDHTGWRVYQAVTYASKYQGKMDARTTAKNSFAKSAYAKNTAAWLHDRMHNVAPLGSTLKQAGVAV